MEFGIAAGGLSNPHGERAPALADSAPLTLAQRCTPAIAILLFTFLFRSQHFGSPDIDFDEPFYLLAGDKILHGAIPYADIWDRKPVGLFLIYAFARLFGAPGFLQYQLLAAAFAAGTGYVMWLIAKRHVARWPAIVPALVYVVWQEPYFGGGGQSAIFYNLLTAASVWLLLNAKDSGDPRTIRRHGIVAMALMGCALQVKYTVLPEGCFFGLAFLFLLLRAGGRLPSIAASAFAFMAVAIVPTAAAAGYFAAVGHFHDFFYANFTSVFDRLPLVPGYVKSNLIYIFVVAVPLMICTVLGFQRLCREERARGRDDHIFLGLWMLAAFIGFAMISNFYWYYFMPVLLPLALLCAPLFAERGVGLLALVLLHLWPMYVSGYWHGDERDRRIASTAALTKLIEQNLNGRCLFIYDGPVTVYQTTQACIPTKFAYPDHLSNDVERPALGVDAAAELERIVSTRPGVILNSPRRVVPIRNKANDALIAQTLRDHYRLVGSVIHKDRPILVYALRQAPAPDRDAITLKGGTSQQPQG